MSAFCIYFCKKKKKEKILLFFFPSTISQNKLYQDTGIENVQYPERCFLGRDKK